MKRLTKSKREVYAKKTKPGKPTNPVRFVCILARRFYPSKPVRVNCFWSYLANGSTLK